MMNICKGASKEVNGYKKAHTTIVIHTWDCPLCNALKVIDSKIETIELLKKQRAGLEECIKDHKLIANEEE